MRLTKGELGDEERGSLTRDRDVVAVDGLSRRVLLPGHVHDGSMDGVFRRLTTRHFLHRRILVAINSTEQPPINSLPYTYLKHLRSAHFPMAFHVDGGLGGSVASEAAADFEVELEEEGETEGPSESLHPSRDARRKWEVFQEGRPHFLHQFFRPLARKVSCLCSGHESEGT